MTSKITHTNIALPPETIEALDKLVGELAAKGLPMSRQRLANTLIEHALARAFIQQETKLAFGEPKADPPKKVFVLAPELPTPKAAREIAAMGIRSGSSNGSKRGAHVTAAGFERDTSGEVGKRLFYILNDLHRETGVNELRMKYREQYRLDPGNVNSFMDVAAHRGEVRKIVNPQTKRVTYTLATGA